MFGAVWLFDGGWAWSADVAGGRAVDGALDAFGPVGDVDDEFVGFLVAGDVVGVAGEPPCALGGGWQGWCFGAVAEVSYPGAEPCVDFGMELGCVEVDGHWLCVAAVVFGFVSAESCLAGCGFGEVAQPCG